MRSAPLSLYAAVLFGSSAALFGATALAQAGGAAQSERAPRYIEGTDVLRTVDPAVVGQAKPAPADAPTSRDELFGTSPAAAAPAASAPNPVTASGFYTATVAYTYTDPTHWSRAVNRFQFNLQGELASNVKWKIGARADVDPVYMSDSFYLPAVQQDQRNDFFWRETYLDFSAGALDFRIGAQNIVWGEVVGLFFADVVSARDLRDFLLPSFDIIRKPQWAARAEYFKGDSHLELIWIPVPTFDDIGKPGSDFYPVPLPSPTTAADAAPFRDPVRPTRTIRNSNYGVRANTLVGGWDLAAFYYRSSATFPTFYRVSTAPLVFQPQHDRIWQTGATVSKDLGDFVLRAEGIYTDGQRHASTEPLASQGVIERDTFDWIVSTDIALPRDARLSLQVFKREYSGNPATLVIDTGGLGFSAQLSGKATPALEPQILWIQTFEGGGLVRPRLNWYPARNATVGLGVDIFVGPADGFFGRYNNRDRVYGEVRYDF